MGDFVRPEKGPWPEKAVLAFTRMEYRIFRDLVPGGKEKKPLWGMSRVTAWPDLVLIGPILGAPQAAMVLETLGRRGVGTFASLGWCGAIQPGIDWGDIILPESAFSEEGVSPLYREETGSEPGADPGLTARLQQVMDRRGMDYRTGRIWSTDAPFRETREKVTLHARAGVSGVDMETSAVMAVARFRNLAWTGLLVVSDKLWTEKWHPGFHSPELKSGLKTAAEAIVELMFEKR